MGAAYDQITQVQDRPCPPPPPTTSLVRSENDFISTSGHKVLCPPAVLDIVTPPSVSIFLNISRNILAYIGFRLDKI